MTNMLSLTNGTATALVLSLLQAPVAPQPSPAAAPSTDVFVAPLTVSGGEITVGAAENVSNGPGYDNQPFFAPDGGALYFTSDRPVDGPPAPPLAAGQKPRGPQTDIYRYDFASRRISRVTTTAESEYSPTVTPDGNHLSVIRVEADGTQRLWRFTIQGGNPSVVLSDVKPVGYHSWLDANTLVLFVLGQPATLQVADARTGKAEVVTPNIGQSIQRMPGGGISFVQQAGEGSARTLTITQITLEHGKPVTKALTPAVAGATQAHVAWTPDGTLLMAHNGSLYAWRAGQTEWKAVADLKAKGLSNVTRLAVSPKGDRIAIVAGQ